MTPEQFIDKWSRTALTERQAAQEHFLDLCRLLGQPTPAEADPEGEGYTFEKGVSKTDGRAGFADVWKRGHFGWEYKKDKANLDRAYQQLQLYSVALENPPLLVVADTKLFRVYTNWTNTVQVRHEFALEDLAHTETRDLLRNVFTNPERLRPTKTREQVTQDAAKEFSTIAERLRMAGHAPEKVAHFLNRLVFCLFAEDVNLLQDDLFKRLLETLAKRRDEVKERSQSMLSELFANMREGGEYGLEHILHFNGGLFDSDEALPLDADSLDILRSIAKQDWSAIDPTIFGTLFERFLDPDKRAQIGAHYTDPGKIMMIVEPVILRPLTAEWEAVKAELTDALSKGRTRDGRPGPAAVSRAEARLDQFLKRLADVRVLDPACGSGNFLYLALQALKDLERRAIVEAVDMGLGLRVIHCGPQNVKGIEINQYAAELARTSIWIGNIQWLRRNGFEARKEPVLDDLEAIECRDALVVELARKISATSSSLIEIEYGEAQWPEAEFIVGNPPFLGSRKMQPELGADYVKSLRQIFHGRVANGADLVCYWFAKSWDALKSGKSRRVGLVATNSIGGGASRLVLDPIASGHKLFEAWRDEPWIVEGAAVRVAIICFANQAVETAQLDGVNVETIFADLHAPSDNHSSDITKAHALIENRDIAFQGVVPRGSLRKKAAERLGLEPATFVLSGEAAREMLLMPQNPNGCANRDVIVPFLVGDDITGRPLDRFIVDFGEMNERDAALYEIPYAFIGPVKSHRAKMTQPEALTTWWQHWRSRPELRAAIKSLNRFIVTSRVAKYRIFVWRKTPTLADNATVVIAREDDATFGILNSKFHEAWSLRRGTRLGVGNDPRYTPTTTFQSFAFPKGLTPNIPAKDYADDPRAQAIAKAAKRLDELRNAWLNPPDLIDIVPEVVPGYPDRILPKNEAAAAELKKRKLTNLYNQRPQWLSDAHRDLDATVATAYGWPVDISEEDALARLLELNLSSSGPVDDLLSEIDDDEDE